MPKRTMQSTVVSDKADKTVIVSVERRIMHPVYKKLLLNLKSLRPMMLKTVLKKVIVCAFVSAHLCQSRSPLKWSTTKWLQEAEETDAIQMQSNLEVADNSGARRVQCIKVWEVQDVRLPVLVT